MASETIPLPAPETGGGVPLHEVLEARRSVRSFGDRPLTLQQVSQLLWACQGITSERGFRTAPSAGALYPLELYLVATSVEGLESGPYHYRPRGHQLVRLEEQVARRELASAALGQSPVAAAPVSFVLGGVVDRTAAKYGSRAQRYVRIEAGHAAQNLLLQAVSLGLGGVPTGAFHDEQVRQLLGMEAEPLYVLPVGHPAP
jgi:SagB-type dehydrogenase family enzyme